MDVYTFIQHTHVFTVRLVVIVLGHLVTTIIISSCPPNWPNVRNYNYGLLFRLLCVGPDVQLFTSNPMTWH